MKRFFEATRDVDAPVEAVWPVVVDVERWPEWTPTVDSVTRLDDGGFGVGSRVEIRQPRLPKARWEVTDVASDGPGRSFTWESVSPGIRTIARHQVAPREGGSRVTLSIDQTGPLGAVVALVWRGLIQRYIETEAKSLDQRVQQHQSR